MTVIIDPQDSGIAENIIVGTFLDIGADKNNIIVLTIN